MRWKMPTWDDVFETGEKVWEWGERIKDLWEDKETIEEVGDTVYQLHDIENDDTLSEPEKAAGILRCMLDWVEDILPAPLVPAEAAKQALDEAMEHAIHVRDHDVMSPQARRLLEHEIEF